jgi:hypothetical protein
MGDSLGDLHMAEGAEKCANLLTVGFLNDKVTSLVVFYLIPEENEFYPCIFFFLNDLVKLFTYISR